MLFRFLLLLILSALLPCQAGSRDSYKLMLGTEGLVFMTKHGWTNEYTPLRCTEGMWRFRNEEGEWEKITYPYFSGLSEGHGILLQWGCKVYQWHLTPNKYLGEPQMEKNELRFREGEWCQVVDGECYDLID